MAVEQTLSIIKPDGVENGHIGGILNMITEGGFKYHMNDVNATFGLVQLNYLEENVNKYIENGLFFDKELKDIDGIEIIKYHNNTK